MKTVKPYYTHSLWRLLVATVLSAALVLPVKAADGANITKGRQLFNQCKACHSITSAGRQRLGPDLEGLFSRHVAARENYKYSAALKEADFIWTEEKLNEWLKKPNAFLPGNKMPYAGMRKEQDRLNLIAYLKEATVSQKRDD